MIADQAPGTKIAGKVANFLTDAAHHDFDSDVVAYYGGATISNLVCPSGDSFPHEILTEELEKLAKLVKSGWIIISYDGIQEEVVLAAYRSKFFGRFIRNPLYRAAHELQTKNFDPDGFSYRPRWIASSHLLANTLVANKDQNFYIASEAFSVRAGEKFDVVNAYKFTPQIFEGSCEQAGFSVIKKWVFESSPMKFYMLKCGSYEADALRTSENRYIRSA